MRSKRRFAVFTFCGVAALSIALIATGPDSGAVQATISLGTTNSFAVLAGSTITNTGPTTIGGDVGLHPGTAVSGFNSVTFTSGSLHLTDGVALQAKTDLVTAYNDAASRGPTTQIPTELGGTTLSAGVYNSASGTFGLTGPIALTLDGGNVAGSVFIFKMASTLITGSASSINLINGADACNVFWQVGSSATLGTGTAFKGTILAMESITLTTGATIVPGRALARTSAVTMDTNTIDRSACTAAATPSATPTAVPTTTPTASASVTPRQLAASSPTPSPTTTPSGSGGPSSAPSTGGTPGGGSTTSQEIPRGGAPIAMLVTTGLGLIAVGEFLRRSARRSHS